jgi:hypothetical protein
MDLAGPELRDPPLRLVLQGFERLRVDRLGAFLEEPLDEPRGLAEEGLLPAVEAGGRRGRRRGPGEAPKTRSGTHAPDGSARRRRGTCHGPSPPTEEELLERVPVGPCRATTRARRRAAVGGRRGRGRPRRRARRREMRRSRGCRHAGASAPACRAAGWRRVGGGGPRPPRPQRADRGSAWRLATSTRSCRRRLERRSMSTTRG